MMPSVQCRMYTGGDDLIDFLDGGTLACLTGQVMIALLVNQG